MPATRASDGDHQVMASLASVAQRCSRSEVLDVLAPNAQAALDRFFAKDCDPIADAEAAATAIYWAVQMDGPLFDAAKALLSLFIPLVLPVRTEEHARAYIADLRAFTLARHAGIWVHFIQMWGSEAAVDAKMTEYLTSFAEALDGHLRELLAERFRPTVEGEPLEKWAAALSLHGRHWIDGRKRGVSDADLMKALWLAA